MKKIVLLLCVLSVLAGAQNLNFKTQGTQAVASTTIPNPIVFGGHDYAGTPAIRALKVDASGNWYGVITFASPQHVIIDSSASIGVTGPLTDTQLRALAVQVQSNSANIATETTAAGIKAKTDNIPAQGQALAAASLPVVLPAAQITTLTPPAAITNFANETGGNLVSIKTNTDKLPALGQAAMAASTPVVIASNQTSVPVGATLNAETTKVIGTVNIAGSQTVGLAGGVLKVGDVGMLGNAAADGTGADYHLLTGADGRQSVNVGQINGVTPLMGAGNTGTGSPRVTIATDQVTLPTTPVASATADGALGCYLQSAATTNATNCKNGAGNFYGFRAVNTTATLYYLRLYNLATAPTCSSATGFIESVPIPASATGAGIVSIEVIPTAYSAGIGFCLTGGGTSTDNTSAATGVYLKVLYK